MMKIDFDNKSISFKDDAFPQSVFTSQQNLPFRTKLFTWKRDGTMQQQQKNQSNTVAKINVGFCHDLSMQSKCHMVSEGVHILKLATLKCNIDK